MSDRAQKYRNQSVRDQDGLCFYCFNRMGRSRTAEHLIPRQDGGTDCRQNIVAACLRCNGERHADKERAALTWFEYGFLVLLELASGLREAKPRAPGADANPGTRYIPAR